MLMSICLPKIKYKNVSICFRAWSERPIKTLVVGTQLGKRRSWQNMLAGERFNMRHFNNTVMIFFFLHFQGMFDLYLDNCPNSA